MPHNPVKLVFDDRTEIPYVRRDHCQCPRSPDHKCSGCEAKSYREAAKEINAQMHILRGVLMKWER